MPKKDRRKTCNCGGPPFRRYAQLRNSSLVDKEPAKKEVRPVQRVKRARIDLGFLNSDAKPPQAYRQGL